MSVAVYLHPLMGAKDFGDWLDRRMKELDMSQATLRRLSGVNEGSLSRYRSGTVLPDPGTIHKLAVPLNADPDELLVIAGHKSGDETAGRTVVIRTEDPNVVRLVRSTEGLDPEEMQRAIDALKVLFPRRKK